MSVNASGIVCECGGLPPRRGRLDITLLPMDPDPSGMRQVGIEPTLPAWKADRLAISLLTRPVYRFLCVWRIFGIFGGEGGSESGKCLPVCSCHLHLSVWTFP